VLLALQGRRVDISGMTAVGYGEATPIADNDSEAGREANRRIEFVLKGVQGATEAGPAAAVPAGPAADGSATGTAAPPANPATAAADGTTDGAEPAPADDAEAAPPAGAGIEAATTGEPAAPAAAPDFSGDTSPSVAPTEKTIRPLPRPEGTGAEGTP
jgi:OmpA-OmpF porin, OOP family